MTEKNKFGYFAIITCLATICFAIFILGFIAVIKLPPSSFSKGVDAPAEAPLTILMNVSAYCPCEKCCGKWADGYTASGKPAQGYLVAASSDYPFGTLMVVPGYANGRPVPVLDRGSAFTLDNCLDVFFEDKDGVSGHQRALNWGRQYLEVEVRK